MRPSPALLLRALCWSHASPRRALRRHRRHAHGTAHTAAALQAARRAVHAAPVEWPDPKRDGPAREVTRLPLGMAPFQSSRAAGDGAPKPAVSASSSADAAAASETRRDAPPASTQTPAICVLPPWPVDAFEFNAMAAHGGHDLRLASGDIPFRFHADVASSPSLSPADATATASLTPELTAHLLTGMGCAMPLSAQTTSTSAASASASAAPPPSAGARTSLLTLETIQQLRAAEEAPAAQAALREGGWVCTDCWSVVGADGNDRDGATDTAAETATLPRTVCPTCHTLRHDAHALSGVLSLRRQSELWKCTACGEVNARATGQCRCCAASQDDAAEASVGEVVHRLTLTEEAAARPVGTVVVTRNRTSRWRCSSCNEVNSLQQAWCRYCNGERFGFTVLCPACEAPRVLSNALTYAGVESTTAALRRYPERLFDAANCYAPYTPHICCSHCDGPLHGGRVAWAHTGGPWWCACGLVNAASTYSCPRCRLPRFVEDAPALRRLLASPLPRDGDGDDDAVSGSESAASASAAHSLTAWDFKDCTNWMCDGCGGVNVASHQIVVEVKVSRAGAHGAAAAASPLSRPQSTVRRMRTVHGVAICRHCGTPWHHQVLRDGEAWRCACHALNGRQDAHCTSCGLPALDGMRPDMLAFWTRGDWRCPSCGILCYRARQRCTCGAVRPATHPTPEV